MCSGSLPRDDRANRRWLCRATPTGSVQLLHECTVCLASSSRDDERRLASLRSAVSNAALVQSSDEILGSQPSGAKLFGNRRRQLLVREAACPRSDLAV
jgi:hypothetical protein